MEAIKNYLENMFLGLPETDEVLKAKQELLEMMEDKYDELIAAGKTHEEAIGIVFSEFGNLEELAEELGIDDQIPKSKKKETSTSDFPKDNKATIHWNENQVKDYILYIWHHAWTIAFAVACFIFAPFATSVTDALSEFVAREVILAIEVWPLLIFVCIGVGLCIKAKRMRNHVPSITKNTIVISENTASFFQAQKEKDEKKAGHLRLVGIILCIISVGPSSIYISGHNFLNEILSNSVLVIVAIGVMLIVTGCSVENRYKELKKATFTNNDPNSNTQNVINYAFSQEPSKKKLRALGICLIVLACFVVLGNIAAISFHFLWREDSSPVLNEETYYNLAEVTCIDISLDTNDLEIKQASDENANNIKLTYSGKRPISADLRNGQLKISQKQKHWNFIPFFSMGDFGGKVTLEIPENANISQYSIDSDLGKIAVEKIYSDNVKISADAGKIDVSSATIDTLKLEADLGSVSLDNVEFNNLTGDLDAGSLSLKTNLTKDEFYSKYDLKLQVDLGSINLYDENSQDDLSSSRSENQGRIKLDADLGSITIN